MSAMLSHTLLPGEGVLDAVVQQQATQRASTSYENDGKGDSKKRQYTDGSRFHPGNHGLFSKWPGD